MSTKNQYEFILNVRWQAKTILVHAFPLFLCFEFLFYYSTIEKATKHDITLQNYNYLQIFSLVLVSCKTLCVTIDSDVYNKKEVNNKKN